MRNWYARDEDIADLDTIREMCEDDINREASDEEVGRWMRDNAWEPILLCTCCGERDLPEHATYPICTRCEGTARAHARYFPGGPASIYDREPDEDRLLEERFGAW